MRWSVRGDHMRDVKRTGGLYCIASETERKCVYMARHGGAASWFFLPYISCGHVIDRHRVQAVEQNNVGMYPNSLNRMRHPSSLYKDVRKGGLAPVTVDLTNDEKHLLIAEWRCECRLPMPMGLCLLVWISMKRSVRILLCYGIVPTPGQPLGLHDDLVAAAARWLYCTSCKMVMGTGLWGCSELRWIQRGHGEWGSDT